MQIFHCGNCQNLVFFENERCEQCGFVLAFLPDAMRIGAVVPADDKTWKSTDPVQEASRYRLCGNYRRHQVCNWAVLDSDSHDLCIACRLTLVYPNLSVGQNKEAWRKLEIAKRRVVFRLLRFGLPLANRTEDPKRGLAFNFLSDQSPQTGKRVLTGHADGVITINIAEADDVEREKRRHQLHEPYRTLLGHVRHEIGHYYWDRLIQNSALVDGFRALFGDERRDYTAALQEHYKNGAPPDWQAHFVSAYASAHPWEDWAETWAHCLHMIDTLETAINCGLSMEPSRAGEPEFQPVRHLDFCSVSAFDEMLPRWLALTYALNNMNRGLGLPDAYPFVLSPPTIEKLRFIHRVIAEFSGRDHPSAEPAPIPAVAAA